MLQVTRRQLLQRGALAWAAAHPLARRAGARRVPLSPFRAGVASGEPDHLGVVLWTRVFPDSAVAAIEVVWELSADPGFTTLRRSGEFTTTADHAHCIHVVAEPGPGEWYYRFRALGFTSPVGRTVIAPAAGATSLRLAAASCQHFESGYYAAHRDIAAQRPDLVLWLGDYIYEDAAARQGAPAVRRHEGGEARTLSDYRARYAQYKSDPDLQAAHAACAWLVMWDDHEVEDNYAGLTPTSPAEAATFPARRDAAYQAWWEHTPTRLAPPVAETEYRVYRTAAWSDLASFVLLDGRQYRTDQACGDRALSLDPPCAALHEPGRTMLGSAQEQFLEERLSASTARWRVIGNQTVMADATVNGSVLNFDQWDGYPDERSRIFAILADRHVANVVVLTGDIHLAAVAQLRQGDPGSGPPIGVEFVSTSISSPGLVPTDLAPILRRFPAMVGAELAHRGYVLHTVTPQRWTAAYRIVADVTDQSSAVSTVATYAVEAGTNTVSLMDG